MHILITGEIGVGKSTLTNRFLERTRNALVYNLTANNRNVLYERILLDLQCLDTTSPLLSNSLKNSKKCEK